MSNIPEANYWKIVQKIEKILLAFDKLKINSNPEIDLSFEEVIIDATEVETPIHT